MTELSTSYLDGPFPMDVPMNNGGKARLLATFGDKVVAVIFWGEPENPWSIDARVFDAEGIYAAEHPSLNLIPPPGLRAAKTAVLRAEIREAELRISSNPDAPATWIENDKRTIARLLRLIDDIEGGVDVIPEAPEAVL